MGMVPETTLPVMLIWAKQRTGHTTSKGNNLAVKQFFRFIAVEFDEKMFLKFLWKGTHY